MPAPPLDGTILLTGASSGIGRAMARQLAPTASALIIVARRESRLQELATELRAAHSALTVSVQPCDLGDLAAVDAMLARVAEEVGPVDVLINCAGLGDIGVFDLADWSKLRLMVDVNCTALTYLTHRLVPGMRDRRRGGVLNVSSGFGLVFMPGVAVYAASKHYVTAFTEGLRLDLVGTGVVVSQVCSGPVDTEFEEVAGNPTGMEVPSLILLSPERCAAVALRGFRRRRALIVPGFWIGLLLWLGRLTPRPVSRLIYRWMAPALRRRELAIDADGDGDVM